ncbi:MAG: kynureninase [Fimbriimonas ginsengisoli]|uniref:Kynureninase n=1 Tax=Fimbriimonas ginsengisoli TaxID=1005039 RepID=A0A931LR71_FIMGI|nr:kynureninase [Fimbriimonas ginsengisoli]MBI3721292.1 kynureninase [Fimbriimonas ginsengisoli]
MTLPDPAQLDAADPLREFRSRFFIDDPDLIYLDGNSLGRMPLAACEILHRQAEDGWGSRLVRGWNEGWFDLPARLGAKIASLIGAEPDEVVVADSTSVNLFKLAAAALEFQSGRSQIVSDDLNFPSDLYVLQGLAQTAGRKVVMARSPDGIEPGDVEPLIGGETALLTLSHTAFKSGAIRDMAAISAAARSVGALTLWDLSHSVGAVPVDLSGSGIDLAIGCTYKYLSGGPGAPAFLYVRRDLQERLRNPIAGWFGQARPFAFELKYEPASSLRRFQTGTPPILSLAAIEPGVDLVIEGGMDRIREKSMLLTGFLADLWERDLRPLGVALNSPLDAARRGSHISFGHPDGWRVDRALIEDARVIPDFREPDNIRFGLSPLYTTFTEVDEAVRRFRELLEQRTYEKYPPARAEVT